MINQVENDARIDIAYALAEYMLKYPTPHLSLEQRVNTLTAVSNSELDSLVPEVEYWLDVLKKDASAG